jgi:hypothetical protein
MISDVIRNSMLTTSLFATRPTAGDEHERRHDATLLY